MKKSEKMMRRWQFGRPTSHFERLTSTSFRSAKRTRNDGSTRVKDERDLPDDAFKRIAVDRIQFYPSPALRATSPQRGEEPRF